MQANHMRAKQGGTEVHKSDAQCFTRDKQGRPAGNAGQGGPVAIRAKLGGTVSHKNSPGLEVGRLHISRECRL